MAQTARVRFYSNACIDRLAMSGTSLIWIDSPAIVQVQTAWNWYGSGGSGGLSSQTSNGGTLLLTPTCATFINTTSSANYLFWVTVVNQGYVTYSSLNQGVYMGYNAFWRNEQNATFSFERTDGDVVLNYFGNGLGNFENYGLVSVNIPSAYSFQVRTEKKKKKIN